MKQKDDLINSADEQKQLALLSFLEKVKQDFYKIKTYLSSTHTNKFLTYISNCQPILNNGNPPSSINCVQYMFIWLYNSRYCAQWENS